MRIAVYGNEVKDDYLPIYRRIYDFLKSESIVLVLKEKIRNILINDYKFAFHDVETFCEKEGGISGVDLLLSIGGDGTFLNAVSYAVEKQIPMAGINCGRLGFLADISGENLEEALKQFVEGDYELENRTLLQIVEPVRLFPGFDFALNELTVHKLDNSSMIKIETFIDNEFLASYWADGLIIGTPTGSTAYSLSVGGPIVTPDLEGLIVTPIASHNLTVRPVVVPDHVEIELRIDGRGQQFMVSVDHRSVPLDFSKSLKIRKAQETFPVVKLNGLSFYTTLRNKLMWGADRRN